MPRHKLAETLAALACAVVPATLAAEAPHRVVVDRVVAVIDDGIVTQTELSRRAAPFMAAYRSSPVGERLEAEPKVRRQVLDSLIDERMIASVAKAEHLETTDAEIDAAIVEVMKSQNLTRAALDQAVHEAGMTDADYRAELSRQLLQARVIQLKVAPKIKNASGLTPDAYRAEVDKASRAFLDQERMRHYVEVRL